MANTTETKILTAAGKALLAQVNAEESPLTIDKLIFANVPDRADYPQPEDVVPTDYVVFEKAVEQRGRLSADAVIYSTTLKSDEGPFQFNWTGAYSSEQGVLVTIDHHAMTPKTADEPGIAGNTLVRSVVLEYKDIAEITNITVDASTWQYDSAKRLKRMDDDSAQALIDMNGKDWFMDDGFLVTPQSTAFKIKAGAGYVSGNRVQLEFDRIVQVLSKPAFIYVDAYREGSPTGEQTTLFDFVVTADEKDDYTDPQGVKHFVCQIAQVLADGSVSDLRPEGEKADKAYVNARAARVFTLLEAKACKLATGSIINVQRGICCRYKITDLESPDGYFDVTMDDGRTLELQHDGVVDVRCGDAVPDGNYEQNTGTDNTSVFSAMPFYAENHNGAKFVAHGCYKGSVKVNRSDYQFGGTAIIFDDKKIPTLEVESYYGSKNFGPYMGRPWEYPEGLAPNVTLHRLTANVVKGQNRITVDTTSGLKKGMTGVLISGEHTLSTPDKNHVPQKFQFVRIADIGANTLLFDEEIYSNMDVTSLDTYFVQWKMLENIRITGLTFKNKDGAVYLHKFGGFYNAHIDITMEAETACGAAACYKRLYLGANCQRGFNGLSTARMTEELIVMASVKTGRLNSGGSSEELSFFIEENPRRVHLINFTARNGRLHLYGGSEHTNITGEVDIDGYSRSALYMTTLEQGARVSLSGKLASSNASYTVHSKYLSKCDVSFSGVILNHSSGKAWDHNTGTSNVQPVFTGKTNADVSSVNYMNVVDINSQSEVPKSKYIYIPDGMISTKISSGVVTTLKKTGLIQSIIKISEGRFRVQLTDEVSGGYLEDVISSSEDVSVPELTKYSDAFEIVCKNSSGALQDPLRLLVEVYI
ncbi:phage tail-collar fiber domain-containing protein [Photobacterium sp. 53610]|uniref:phage tail-collar fiber domain-containing protein n=1 Tax=Photobacterium sp. 53610 TaxID=3102789 RepID=UPI002ED92FA5